MSTIKLQLLLQEIGNRVGIPDDATDAMFEASNELERLEDRCAVLEHRFAAFRSALESIGCRDMNEPAVHCVLAAQRALLPYRQIQSPGAAINGESAHE